MSKHVREAEPALLPRFLEAPEDVRDHALLIRPRGEDHGVRVEERHGRRGRGGRSVRVRECAEANKPCSGADAFAREARREK